MRNDGFKLSVLDTDKAFIKSGYGKEWYQPIKTLVTGAIIGFCRERALHTAVLPADVQKTIIQICATERLERAEGSSKHLKYYKHTRSLEQKFRNNISPVSAGVSWQSAERGLER